MACMHLVSTLAKLKCETRTRILFSSRFAFNLNVHHYNVYGADRLQNEARALCGSGVVGLYKLSSVC
jgi:hypothetical protein